MEEFIMDNPTLFTTQDYKNFVDVGFITQDEYNELMATYGPQPATSSASTTAQSSAISASSVPASPAPQSSSTEPTPSSSAPQSFYQPNQSSNATK